MCSPALTMVAMARCIAACPPGGGDGPDTALQRRDPFLEHGGGRIGDSRVHVAGAPLGVEQCRGVVGVAEDVRRRLVDGRRARAGRRIGGGVLARMEAQRVEVDVSGSGHGRSRRGRAGLEGNRLSSLCTYDNGAILQNRAIVSRSWRDCP